ncbi:MAG TPA: hypothetical protein VK815_09245, partial [Candidatus Acidoferrales bacterium]|nr:hypothetical protein [Candidatus Acidoferrales bacterium]
YTLSMPNPANDTTIDGVEYEGVYSDLKTLLSYWPLNDDAQYPWRTDGIWQIAPLMSRDEIPANVSLSAGDTAILRYDGDTPVLWVDPAAGLYTGKILGMPVRAALSDPNSLLYNPDFSPDASGDYQDFFDYLATVWKACQFTALPPDGGTYVDFFITGYGQWLSDAIALTGAQLPHCATQWTNNYDAMNKRPYAWLIQGDSEPYDSNGQPSAGIDFHAHRGDALWGQKCAEVKELWPSQNFGRPGGADKFSFDETQVYCIAGITGEGEGATITLSTTSGDSVTLTDASGYWGGKSVGGFYAITWDGSQVTLGAKTFDLPTGWTSPSGDDDTVFGKLRFPDAPPILGRLAVSAVADMTGVRQLTVEACPYLGLGTTPDAVDICAADMTVLAAAVAVTRVSDTTFTVPTALATIASAKYLVTHGAPAWYWDDNGIKGDFVVHQWLSDFRTNGEAGRLDGINDCNGNPAAPAGNRGFNTDGSGFQQTPAALPFVPCCPQVIAITPNGETWPQAVVIPFPDTFKFDEYYGAKWQAEIEQAMVDLFWQTPHPPCGLTPPDRWMMDDGSCPKSDPPNDNGGTDHLYAHAPLVEARITLPGNGGNNQDEAAPDLPAGVSIGYRSPVDYDDGLKPHGQIGYDPTTGNPTPAWTFWGYRLAIENNGCAPSVCRFNYVATENLPCVTSYAPAPPAPEPDSNTAEGNTAEGLT